MNNFKIVAINSQGFFEDEINRFISNHRPLPDVLIVAEHKQRNLSTIRYSVRGYDLAAGYPASTGQRGTAVFVKDDLSCAPRHDLNRFSREGVFESASVEILTPGTNVVVTGLYRSPNSRITDYNTVLDHFAKCINNEPNKIHVIGGDINIDLRENSTTNRVLSDNNLRSHIRSATQDSGRCLDNFITLMGSNCSGRRLTSTFSDHRPIQLIVPTMNTASLARSMSLQSVRRGRARGSFLGSSRRQNSSRAEGCIFRRRVAPYYRIIE